MRGHIVEPFEGCNALTSDIIGAACAVHTELGPGLAESIYEEAIGVEFRRLSIPHVRQPSFPIEFRGVAVGVCRPDFVVAGRVVVELKASERSLAVYKAQLVKYLHIVDAPIGLLLNFRVRSMRQGIRRVINA